MTEPGSTGSVTTGEEVHKLKPAMGLSELAEIEQNIPLIRPILESSDRPFWSVMIPTYNCAQYLRKTLTSVLQQDLGAPNMQIEVIDDCSTTDDPRAVVEELGAGRVSFFRSPTNQGATRTFNTCIKRARGHWVHILHGDDMVLPGFYHAYGRLINEVPGASLVFGRAVNIDEDDRWLGIGGYLADTKGRTSVLEGFLPMQATRNVVLFPAAVVRRSVYETVGGFCTSFGHIADMDMWFRAGQAGKVVCSAAAHCCYRWHTGADTNRHMLSASNIRELYLLSCANSLRLRHLNLTPQCDWQDELAGFAEGTAWRFLGTNCDAGALNQARWAWRLRPNYPRLKLLMRAWLGERLARFWPAR